MFVIIAGGGRTGTQLAILLLEQNHQVHVVENRNEVLARLHHDLPTEVIYEGNPTDTEILEQAGIRRAQVLAVCTANDADNLSICYLARTQYNVPRTIGRVNNPRNAWLFDEKFHVDVALNQAEIMARLIEEEMSMGDMMTLLKLRRGEFSLIEEKTPPGAKAIGVAIKDLALPEHCVIAAIIRHGNIVLPRGITQLEIGDEVLAITDAEGADQLAVLFSVPRSNSI
ncbi:MAG: TrkA family potassium uptake protein [Chloroflexota bacterium]|nr:MAG: TrkA family potassium uptake protein [Chloroflexota bacterium]